MKNKIVMILVIALVCSIISIVALIMSSNNDDIINSIVGEWIPSKAILQNGEEISLNQLWGSSINYGGTLNIYLDGTYTEYIGAYAESEPLEGICRVDDGKLKLISNIGKQKEINIISEKEIEINYNDFFVLEEYKNCVITFKKIQRR